MLPKGFLVGNLTVDPQSGVAGNSNNYSRFSVACNVTYSKANTAPQAHFFRCVAWGSRAQFIQNFLKKGDKVFIEFSLSTNSYVDKEGKNVNSIDLIVDNIESIRTSGGQMNSNTSSNAAANNNDSNSGKNDSSDDADEDIDMDEVYTNK